MRKEYENEKVHLKENRNVCNVNEISANKTYKLIEGVAHLDRSSKDCGKVSVDAFLHQVKG